MPQAAEQIQLQRSCTMPGMILLQLADADAVRQLCRTKAKLPKGCKISIFENLPPEVRRQAAAQRQADQQQQQEQRRDTAVVEPTAKASAKPLSGQQLAAWAKERVQGRKRSKRISGSSALSPHAASFSVTTSNSFAGLQIESTVSSSASSPLPLPSTSSALSTSSSTSPMPSTAPSATCKNIC